MTALACGVPLLATPLGRDQADIAARVVEAGAARVSAIRRAVARLLDEPAFTTSARRWRPRSTGMCLPTTRSTSSRSSRLARADTPLIALVMELGMRLRLDAMVPIGGALGGDTLAGGLSLAIEG
jgi:hypothetical protein